MVRMLPSTKPPWTLPEQPNVQKLAPYLASGNSADEVPLILSLQKQSVKVIMMIACCIVSTLTCLQGLQAQREEVQRRWG